MCNSYVFAKILFIFQFQMLFHRYQQFVGGNHSKYPPLSRYTVVVNKDICNCTWYWVKSSTKRMTSGRNTLRSSVSLGPETVENVSFTFFQSNEIFI